MTFKKTLILIVLIGFIINYGIYYYFSRNNVDIQNKILISKNKKHFIEYAFVSKSNECSFCYNTIKEALQSNYNNILIDKGIYNINGLLELKKDNLHIKGVSRSETLIIETNPSSDLIGIYGNNITIENLTLDTKTNNAYSTLSTGNIEGNFGNNITLNNLDIYGGDKSFVIFFSGPKHNSNNIFNTYENNLNHGNTIKNCYIESNTKWDGVVFALQNKGKIINNIIKGNMLAIYMSKNIKIQNNKILNSQRSGIFLTNPSENNIIYKNEIINSTENGITSYFQLDHPNTPKKYKYGTGNIISSNIINKSQKIGISINYLSNGIITNNSIIDSIKKPLLLIESSGNKIKNNIVN